LDTNMETKTIGDAKEKGYLQGPAGVKEDSKFSEEGQPCPWGLLSVAQRSECWRQILTLKFSIRS
jgi:hypothetical protein